MISDSLHLTSPRGLWYLWHHRHYICGYMSTLFNIKDTVLRQYNHYMWNHKFHICICVITHTALMIKHTLYLQHGTYYIYGTICTVFDISPTIYDNTTLYPLISLLYLISNWLYLKAHPMYFSHHTQIIDHIAPIVCMITQAQYVWHHMNTYDITSTLYDITPRYDLHTHCIHLITPRIPVITSTAAELLLTVYWVYHICNMCDLKPTICVASHEFYVTSHPQYSWIQNWLYKT